MREKLSFLDQAAEKLRRAMKSPASGVDRMCLIQEALTLYHLHQADDSDLWPEDLGPYARPGSGPDAFPDA